MDKIGKCDICGKYGDLKKKLLSFTNVICECCSIGFHQDECYVCMDCIHAKPNGNTKISFTNGTYTVPVKMLYDNNKLSPSEMKKLIKTNIEMEEE